MTASRGQFNDIFQLKSFFQVFYFETCLETSLLSLSNIFVAEFEEYTGWCLFRYVKSCWWYFQSGIFHHRTTNITISCVILDICFPGVFLSCHLMAEMFPDIQLIIMLMQATLKDLQSVLVSCELACWVLDSPCKIANVSHAAESSAVSL